MRYDGSPLLDHAVAVASIVISEVGLGRNSSVASILHDVVRLAHKQLPAEEFLALSADIRKRFGDQVVGITLGSGQHLGAEAQGGQGAGRQFPGPDRELLRRPARDPDQTGRPARSDALAGNVPARKVAQEELGVDEPLRPDRPQAGPLLDQERAGGHRPEIPRTEGLRTHRHEARRERRGAHVRSSGGSSCRSSSGCTASASNTTSRAAPSRSSRSGARCTNSTSRSRASTTSSPSASSSTARQGGRKTAVLDGLFGGDGLLHPQSQPHARLDLDPQVERLRVAAHHRVGRRALGRGADPHRTHGRRSRARHRGALALQGGQPGGADQRNVAGTPARTDRGYDARAGAAFRRQTRLGRNLRLHAQRRPAETPRGGHGAGFRLRHPHLAGLDVRGRTRSTTVRCRSASSCATATSSKSLTQKNQTPEVGLADASW